MKVLSFLQFKVLGAIFLELELTCCKVILISEESIPPQDLNLIGFTMQM